MILATRDLEKPTVEGTVKKYVERSPQKLRQIGLNYDIAHAKGYRADAAVEASDENCERKQPGVEKSAESGAEGEYGEPEDEEGDWNTEEGEDQASDQQNSEPDLPARKPEGASLSKTTSSPWNAVCVISLRVFSKNNEVTLKLVGPQNMDGAALDADEIIAGVTM